MTQTEALKLALEALDSASNAIESWGSYASEYFQDKHDLQVDINNTQQAIITIKAALEAKYEPVAWMYDWTTSDGEFIQNWTTSEAESLRDTEPNIITNVRPLYTTPQPCPTCESLARAVMMDQTGKDS
jgi:hypothetical protein